MESDIQQKQTGLKERGIAYVVEDHFVGDFEVKRSANAWWMNNNKVEIIIFCLKEGHTIKAACIHAGVSRSMWQYFNKIHPEFVHIIERCEECNISTALETINRNLKDPKVAKWYLEKRHPKFKTRFTLDDIQGRQTPSIESDFGFYETEINDPEKLAAKLMHVAQTLLAESKTNKS